MIFSANSLDSATSLEAAGTAAGGAPAPSVEPTFAKTSLLNSKRLRSAPRPRSLTAGMRVAKPARVPAARRVRHRRLAAVAVDVARCDISKVSSALRALARPARAQEA